jgi:hypothetical protein
MRKSVLTQLYKSYKKLCNSYGDNSTYLYTIIIKKYS